MSKATIVDRISCQAGITSVRTPVATGSLLTRAARAAILRMVKPPYPASMNTSLAASRILIRRVIPFSWVAVPDRFRALRSRINMTVRVADLLGYGDILEYRTIFS